MRLWCGQCGTSCGRVERDATGDWVCIGLVRIPPFTYHDDAAKPWHKVPQQVNLSAGLLIRLTCSKGHTVVGEGDALIAAAQAGGKSVVLG